jgi:NRE family putative nickel resistance protein-like MFS transporter
MVQTTTSSSSEQAPGLWRNRSFVVLFAAQVISLVGSGATTIGLALFAYQLAGASSATIVVGNALTLRISSAAHCSGSPCCRARSSRLLRFLSFSGR